MVSRTCIQKLGILEFTALSTLHDKDGLSPWGPLASQHSLLREFQDSEKLCLIHQDAYHLKTGTSCHSLGSTWNTCTCTHMTIHMKMKGLRNMEVQVEKNSITGSLTSMMDLLLACLFQDPKALTIMHTIPVTTGNLHLLLSRPDMKFWFTYYFPHICYHRSHSFQWNTFFNH